MLKYSKLDGHVTDGILRWERLAYFAISDNLLFIHSFAQLQYSLGYDNSNGEVYRIYSSIRIPAGEVKI